MDTKAKTLLLSTCICLTATVAAASGVVAVPAVGSRAVSDPIAGIGSQLSDSTVVENLGRSSSTQAVIAYGGSALRVHASSGNEGSLVIPARGRVGATALASNGRTALVAWCEESREGRAVFAQRFRPQAMKPIGRQITLASAAQLGGSMHQPGVELAWNGSEFAAVWLTRDGQDVNYATIKNGQVLDRRILATGATVWPQIAAIPDGFVVGWLDRSLGSGEVRGVRLSSGRVADFALPNGPHGAFDLAFDGSEVVAAVDLIQTSRTDQAVMRVPIDEGAPRVVYEEETWEREYDPGLTVLDDGSVLLARAVRNHEDQLELSVLRIDGEKVTPVTWFDASPAQEIRAPRVVRNGSVLSLTWMDDRAEPWRGRHVLWSADLADGL